MVKRIKEVLIVILTLLVISLAILIRTKYYYSNNTVTEEDISRVLLYISIDVLIYFLVDIFDDNTPRGNNKSRRSNGFEIFRKHYRENFGEHSMGV